MVVRRGSELAAELGAVRERIERWREHRRRGSPMPAELWDAAASLARTHGVYAVSRELRVSYESLRRRASGARPRREVGHAPCSGFVELSAAQLLAGPLALTEGAVVEVTDRTGSRLTVRLGGGDELDVVELVGAFLGR
jgi:hypothetical protein